MLLLLALSVSSVSYAQVQTQNLSADVDAELNRLYKTSQIQQQPVAKPAVQQQQPVVSQTILVPQQVQQQTAQAAVQSQPTTVIEATPLTNSRADAIRKTRQEEEMKTETKIVEKLEQSRMEDEKRRADVLFGNKFEAMQQQQQAPAVVAAPVVVAQPVQATPTPVVVAPAVVEAPKDSLSRDAVREEIRAALDEKDMKDAAEPEKEMYASGLAGFPMVIGTDDISAKNIKGKGALGVSIGTRISENLLVEGGFMMSSYSADEIRYDYNPYMMGYVAYTVPYDLKQYSGLFAARYQMSQGRLRPVIGGLAIYSYRQYTYQGYGYQNGTTTGDSHALDIGILGGLDFEISKSFALGFDVKYMINLSNKVNANYQYAYASQVGKPVEQLPWMVVGATARLNF